MPGNIKNASVRLLTFRAGGHTLNRRQALSPKHDWAVFDTRNDDTLIGQTHSVERIALKTGKIETVYETVGQTAFGPGVGAVAYHPTLDRVAFIHGLLNCDATRPYGMARRFGAIVDLEQPNSMFPAEGRIVDSEPPLGILSGGTHAHSWSPSGKRISFTYNDARNVNMPRTVGFTTTEVLSPFRNWDAKSRLGNDYDEPENFGGRFASFLVLIPGNSTKLVNGQSVVIQQALEECWIDDRRLAFLGTIESDGGQPIQEIFVSNLPSDASIEDALKSGSLGMVPPDMTLERITNTSLNGPRVSGPRHWLTADPSGAWIYTLATDRNGIVQLARVASTGGSLELLTQLTESIEGQMSCSPSGEEVGFICGGKIHVWSSATREVDCWHDSRWIDSDGVRITPPILDSGYVGAIHFVDSNTIIANRYVRIDDSPYLQIVEGRNIQIAH
ncbi:MAG: DUF3748 domain-containing protein [Pirellula sp.]